MEPHVVTVITCHFMLPRYWLHPCYFIRLATLICTCACLCVWCTSPGAHKRLMSLSVYYQYTDSDILTGLCEYTHCSYSLACVCTTNTLFCPDRFCFLVMLGMLWWTETRSTGQSGPINGWFLICYYLLTIPINSTYSNIRWVWTLETVIMWFWWVRA